MADAVAVQVQVQVGEGISLFTESGDGVLCNLSWNTSLLNLEAEEKLCKTMLPFQFIFGQGSHFILKNVIYTPKKMSIQNSQKTIVL